MGDTITCTICFDDLLFATGDAEETKKAVVLACGHAFHETCIKTVHGMKMQSSGSYVTLDCPICSANHCTTTPTAPPKYTRLFLSLQPSVSPLCSCTRLHPVPLVNKAASVYRLMKEMESSATSVPAALTEFNKFCSKKQPKGTGELTHCEAMSRLMADGVRQKLDGVLEVLQCWKSEEAGLLQVQKLIDQIKATTAHLVIASERLTTYIKESKAKSAAQTELECSNRMVRDLLGGISTKSVLVETMRSRADAAEKTVADLQKRVMDLQAEASKAQQKISALTKREKDLSETDAQQKFRIAGLESGRKVLEYALEKIGNAGTAGSSRARWECTPTGQATSAAGAHASLLGFPMIGDPTALTKPKAGGPGPWYEGIVRKSPARRSLIAAGSPARLDSASKPTTDLLFNSSVFGPVRPDAFRSPYKSEFSGGSATTTSTSSTLAITTKGTIPIQKSTLPVPTVFGTSCASYGKDVIAGFSPTLMLVAPAADAGNNFPPKASDHTPAAVEAMVVRTPRLSMSEAANDLTPGTGSLPVFKFTSPVRAVSSLTPSDVARKRKIAVVDMDSAGDERGAKRA